MPVTDAHVDSKGEVPEKRLSIAACRRILKRPDLTDAEVEQARDLFYALSSRLVEMYKLL